MHDRFEKRIEEGLEAIVKACGKKRRDVATMARRVGRLLGQNTRAAGLFDVQVTADAKGAAQVKWSKLEEWRSWATLSEGWYLLRTNVNDWSGEELWRAYMQCRAFPCSFPALIQAGGSCCGRLAAMTFRRYSCLNAYRSRFPATRSWTLLSFLSMFSVSRRKREKWVAERRRIRLASCPSLTSRM